VGFPAVHVWRVADRLTAWSRNGVGRERTSSVASRGQVLADLVAEVGKLREEIGQVRCETAKVREDLMWPLRYGRPLPGAPRTDPYVLL